MRGRPVDESQLHARGVVMIDIWIIQFQYDIDTTLTNYSDIETKSIF